jgi:hypothetical protein
MDELGLVRLELNKLNAEANRVTTRMNRAYRERREISLAAKPVSSSTKKASTMSAIGPSAHIGDGFTKSELVTKEKVMNIVPNSWKDFIQAQLDALPEMTREVTHVVMFTSLSSILLFCQCVGDGQTKAEACKTVLYTTPAMAGFGLVVASVQKFVGVPLVKHILQGLVAESDIAKISLLGSCVSSFFVGIAWDIIGNCMQLMRDHNLKEFGDRFLRSFASNSFKAILYGAVASFCPTPITVLVCIFGAFAEDDMRQKDRDLNQPYYISLGDFIFRTAMFVPYTMYDMLLATDEEMADVDNFRLELFDRNCPALVCSVTYDVLDDPVYLNGAVVSRYIAERQVNHLGRDFYNDREVTLDDIKELPEFRRLLRKADKILQKVRTVDNTPPPPVDACEF